MHGTWRLLTAMFLLLSTATACDSPVVPSPSSEATSRSFDGGSTGLPGRPIAIGQTVEADLQAGSSSGCDFGNDPYPCARYRLDLAQPGRVVVRMDFSGAQRPMFIAFETPKSHAGRNNFVAIGGSPLDASFEAGAGQLTLAVGVDAPYGLGFSAVYRYRFVTTFE